MAAQPGAPYSYDRLPEVGSLVVFANGVVAARHKARHAWVVMRVTAASQRGRAFSLDGGVSVCGVGDGVELTLKIDDLSDLAEAGESTGWMAVHYAVATGCGLKVVEAVLEAYAEVTCVSGVPWSAWLPSLVWQPAAPYPCGMLVRRIG